VSAIISMWLPAAESGRQWAVVEVECAQVPAPRTDPSEFSQTVTLSVAEFRQHRRTRQLTELGLARAGLEHLGLLCRWHTVALVWARRAG
jgi:hypothetical protein